MVNFQARKLIDNGEEYFLLILRDITKRKFFEQELFKITENLERLVEEKTQELQKQNEILEQLATRDVLTNLLNIRKFREYFISICSILIVASIIGAALNVIPYFFFDFTETKQKSTINVLKIRALFEDYANGVLSDEKLVEAVDIIREAELYCKKTPYDVSNAKYALRQAKSKGKAEYAAAKAELRRQKEGSRSS